MIMNILKITLYIVINLNKTVQHQSDRQQSPEFG